jgi:hypothetical protein
MGVQLLADTPSHPLPAVPQLKQITRPKIKDAAQPGSDRNNCARP